MHGKRWAIVLPGLFLIWYLGFKQDDYLVRFKINTPKGTLYRLIHEWNEDGKPTREGWKILEETPYRSIKQIAVFKGRTLELNWKLKSLNDSVTQVRLGFVEPEHKIYNRLTAPFRSTPFKQALLDLSNEFKSGSEVALKEKFEVHPVHVDQLPSIQYAYLPIKHVAMKDKAAEMMKNNADLMRFLNDSGLKKKGIPFLIIDQWDQQKELLDFRFCFEVEEIPSNVQNSPLQFDEINPRAALKNIYNGNYIYSDKAWFALDDYAKEHDLKVENRIIEVFRNNPFTESNERKWVTEVFMPLIK